MAHKSKKKPDDDDDDDDDEDPHAFLARGLGDAPLPQPIRPLTSFDTVPAALRKAREEIRRNGGEGSRWTISVNQKRRRSTSKGENSAQYAEGDTTMVAGKPAAENLAGDQPTAKRQKVDEPPVPRQIIVHELQEGRNSYQQGPSVEEQDALFVDDEQAIGEKPRVILRLPW